MEYKTQQSYLHEETILSDTLNFALGQVISFGQ